MKELGIVENLAIFEVVPLCITEALFEVIFDGNQGRVLARVQLRLDLVEGDGLLNYGVIVWVGAFIGETRKID